jgi:hypothetical protein
MIITTLLCNISFIKQEYEKLLDAIGALYEMCNEACVVCST